MNPSDLRKHLPSYADGELDPSLRAEVEAHVASDAASAAEVERWQAIRRTARRGLDREPVPAGLAARIRAKLPAPVRPRRHTRFFRLGAPGLAIAAAVLLVFVLRPETAKATNAEATSFAEIYRRCAVTHRHDTLGVRDEHGVIQPEALRKVQQQVGFPSTLPDLARGGTYYLDGACQCWPGSDLNLVHTYFRKNGDPNQVVSIFIVDRPVLLCSNGKPCGCCGNVGTRRYSGENDGDVAIVCWQDGNRGYVMACEQMSRRELVQLADGLNTAMLQELATHVEPAFAANARP